MPVALKKDFVSAVVMIKTSCGLSPFQRRRKVICSLSCLAIFIFTNLAGATRPDVGSHSSFLTKEQIQRVHECKRLIAGADGKSVEESIADLEKSPTPEENLQLFEAMARTFAEIVEEQKVADLKKKQWLYSMVNLNMAFLQLGGINIKQTDDSPLNRMIRRKLREHLSAEIKENKEIFHPLD